MAFDSRFSGTNLEANYNEISSKYDQLMQLALDNGCDVSILDLIDTNKIDALSEIENILNVITEGFDAIVDLKNCVANALDSKTEAFDVRNKILQKANEIMEVATDSDIYNYTTGVISELDNTINNFTCSAVQTMVDNINNLRQTINSKTQDVLSVLDNLSNVLNEATQILSKTQGILSCIKETSENPVMNDLLQRLDPKTHSTLTNVRELTSQGLDETTAIKRAVNETTNLTSSLRNFSI